MVGICEGEGGGGRGEGGRGRGGEREGRERGDVNGLDYVSDH